MLFQVQKTPVMETNNGTLHQKKISNAKNKIVINTDNNDNQ